MKKTEILHVGKKGSDHVILKKTAPETFQWFEGEKPTEIKGITPEEACRLARQEWKYHNFRFLDCGKRFTLPERDEIGTNALFCQMVASYSTPNNIYYDEELGHSCVVREASEEALDFWRKL